jgi:hypothetical protein
MNARGTEAKSAAMTPAATPVDTSVSRILSATLSVKGANMVKRLRWWHRNRVWRGHAGWVYTWERPDWVGYMPGKPHLDWVYLRPDLDTANYGPYELVTQKPFSGEE